MPAMKLTGAACRDAAGPPADAKTGSRILWCDQVAGFGLRITKAGAKAFVLQYRAGRTSRQLTIGSYPDWKTAQAREEARRLKRLIDQGRDPMAERRAEREAPTMANLCADYLKDHISHKRPRSASNDRQTIAKYILPNLGKLKVKEVSLTRVESLHRDISKKYPVAANRMLALLSTMFNLAIRDGWIASNPAKGVKKNPEHHRERYLTHAEITRLLETLESRPDETSANAVRLLLLTGARRNEVLGAKWQEFDLNEGVWLKPATATKQKRSHRIPLNAVALELLRDMRKITDAEVLVAKADGRIMPKPTYLFPARRGSGHQKSLHTFWDTVREQAGFTDLRLHDLRHSFASLLASSGMSLQIIGALLGHSQIQTTARYAHLLDQSLREATGRVAEVIRLKRPR